MEPTTTWRKREFTRVTTMLEVRVVAPHATRDCTSRNVSMKGVFAETGSPFPVDTQVGVTVLLSGAEPAIAIEARGRVAYAGADGMGIEFSEILGLESFEHLRNLVLFNAAEPDRAEAEIGRHLGIKSPDE